jgi:hypothetical protein
MNGKESVGDGIEDVCDLLLSGFGSSAGGLFQR